MATYYLDFENGNDANDGTTFANRWKSLTNGATAARIAPVEIDEAAARFLALRDGEGAG